VTEKEKILIEIITIPMEDTSVLAKEILSAEDVEEAVVDALDVVEEETIVSIYKMSNVSMVAKRVNFLQTSHSQKN
jgi:hypothetical protein